MAGKAGATELNPTPASARHRRNHRVSAAL